MIPSEVIHEFTNCDYVIGEMEKALEVERGEKDASSIKKKDALNLRDVLITLFTLHNIRRSKEMSSVTLLGKL